MRRAFKTAAALLVLLLVLGLVAWESAQFGFAVAAQSCQRSIPQYR